MVSEGCAQRVRAYYFEQLVDGTGMLGELGAKLRLFESALPIVTRIVGVKGVRSLVDLLPQGDVEATFVLQGLHDWCAEMLDSGATVVEGDATEIAGELLPAAAPASSGTLEAGAHLDQPHDFAHDFGNPNASANVCVCGRPPQHPLHR